MRRRGYVNRKCERFQPEKPNPTPKDVSTYEDCGLRSSIYCASPINSSVASTANNATSNVEKPEIKKKSSDTAVEMSPEVGRPDSKTLGSGEKPAVKKESFDTAIELSPGAGHSGSKALNSGEKPMIKNDSLVTAIELSPGAGHSGSKTLNSGEKPVIKKDSLVTAIELSEAECSVKK